ncbi:ParB/RepB/Spo0J family partition protein [Alicyclobacillaceae bacterium I2511]|nr:ParB/RepB/Spo0J family partition protein [Alicyclobacillaceae bacterium I2511]
MSRKVLGRGLDALLPQLDVSEQDVVSDVSVRDLRPNPYQPRREFDEQKLEELAQSIREHGIIQPLIVRRSSILGYDIVAGERRFRAAQLAGLDKVPVVVRSFTDVELMEVAIIENLQREDLNAMEVAEAYTNLMEKAELTQEELAHRVGQSRSHVANMLRLLQLPSPIRQYVSRGTLTMGHARALLAVPEEEERIRLADKAVQSQMSVRKLESLIYEPKRPVSRETQRDPHLGDLERKLTETLGTQVTIQPGKKHGKIEIDYYSDEDLMRILQHIKD